MTCKITIKPAYTSEKGWLIAIGEIGGKKVIGYGTTHYNAFLDCVRDYNNILKLTA